MSYCPAAQIGRNEGNLAAIVTHNRLRTVFENSNSYSKATIVKFDVVEGRIQTEPEILAQHSRNRINRDTAHLVFFCIKLCVVVDPLALSNNLARDQFPTCGRVTWNQEINIWRQKCESVLIVNCSFLLLAKEASIISQRMCISTKKWNHYYSQLAWYAQWAKIEYFLKLSCSLCTSPTPIFPLVVLFIFSKVGKLEESQWGKSNCTYFSLYNHLLHSHELIKSFISPKSQQSV